MSPLFAPNANSRREDCPAYWSGHFWKYLRKRERWLGHQWEHWRKPLIYVLVLAFAYFCLAIFFALGYRARSAIVQSAPLSLDADSPTDFWDYLHFSFTTQATVGYGDYCPVGYARWMAAVQAFLGICLTSSAIAVIVFFSLRWPAWIVFSKHCCYAARETEEKKRNFRFRFSNEGDDLIGASVRVDFHTDPKDDSKTSRARRVPLDDESDGIIIYHPHLSQYQSCFPDDKSKSDRIVPTDLQEGVCFTFVVSGTLQRTGQQVAKWKKYDLKDIRCGAFIRADEDFSKLDEIKETTEAECQRCEFHPQCPLELAKRIRRPLLAIEQRDWQREWPPSIWNRWVG